MKSMYMLKCTLTIQGLVLIALMLNGTQALAEVPENLQQVTVDRAVIVALENNHEYKRAVKNMKAAKEKVNRVWGTLLPSLESEASAMRQGAEQGFMSLSDGQYDLKLVQLTFGINPGTFYHSLKGSQKKYTSAKEEVCKIKSELEYNVIKSYFDVLLSHEMVTLRENSIQVLEENLKDVKQKYRAGSVPRFELLQAQVKLKSQEPLLIEAQNGYRMALDMLNFHMGVDTPRYTVQADVIKDAESIKKPALRKKVKQSLVDLALKNRPEVIQVSLLRDSIAHGKKAGEAAYLWPTFSVGGYYGKTYLLANEIDMGLGGMGPSPDLSQVTGEREWQNTWQVRVAATYRWGSLLPVDKVQAKKREEGYRLEEAGEKLLQLKRRIAINIRYNHTGLLSAYQSIQSQDENVNTAEEGLRIARESYRAGVITNAELLGSELALTEARTGYIKAVYEYHLSLARLNRETGTEIEHLIFGEEQK
ncbi:MAG: TolC family protein [Spirochaetota bacterium]